MASMITIVRASRVAATPGLMAGVHAGVLAGVVAGTLAAAGTLALAELRGVLPERSMLRLGH